MRTLLMTLVGVALVVAFDATEINYVIAPPWPLCR